jgi:nucleoside-diphosphate-sugar epimerase
VFFIQQLVSLVLLYLQKIMQTILGAGGSVSNELVKELQANHEPFRLVSRTAKQIAGGEWISADVLNRQSVVDAVKGSSIVYLLIGLKYDIRIWKESWPKIMSNVIEACKQHQAKLIFFDNVYSYGLVNGVMTENTPYNPASKKGEVRARISLQLMDEAKKGNLRASIARAADFYGPKNEKSFLSVLVFDRLSKGQRAQLMTTSNKVHSYTFVPDIGKALYILAKNDSSFNQIWHMPTASPALTGKQWVEKVAAAFNVKPSYMVLNKFMFRMAGLFDRNIYEAVEMLYQFENDYIFDSSKFENAFRIKPTSYDEGIRLSVPSYRS